MRVASSLLALLISLALAMPGAVAAAPRVEPKVAVIVGPVGDSTPRFRSQGEKAALMAERFTSNVVRVYTPDATWAAVKQAVDGAAIVIYLGHGNGWPSRYRDSLFPPTQNGFGLNPVAGGDDEAHQYFGEERVAAELKFAENAVVLLHHLCYASGNTEPGLPEGTVEQARQRIDNYAAGFIAAGAGAVVAEGHLGPAWYVEQLLGGDRSIRDIWRASPNVRGNESSWESIRSPGHVAAMDPDHGTSGFYRSIVYRDGVGAGELTATPTVVAPPEPAEPSLVGSGLKLETPYVKGRPVAGKTTRLWIPYSVEDAAALDGLTIGTRWDPIDVAGAAADEDEAPADEDEAADEDGAPDEADPDATQEPASDADSTASPEPTVEPSAQPDDAVGEEDEPETGGADPETVVDPSKARISYIEPERLGSVVEPVAARIGATRVVVDVAMPEQAGRYRLVMTLHDEEATAYDRPTQALVPGVIVQVNASVAARYLVAPHATAQAGGELRLPLAVANVGSKTWGQAPTNAPRSAEDRAAYPVLVAHWMALDVEETDLALPADTRVQLTAGQRPGARKRLALDLVAPKAPGTYLLVLDLTVPGVGSLVALGLDPALVRVLVE